MTEPVALLVIAVTLSAEKSDAGPGVVISDPATARGSVVRTQRRGMGKRRFTGRLESKLEVRLWHYYPEF